MKGSKGRRIEVEGTTYLWHARVRHRPDGRTVTMTVCFAETGEDGRSRRRGPPLLVHLQTDIRGTGAWIDVGMPTPRHVRTAILFARARGWEPAEKAAQLVVYPADGLHLDGFFILLPPWIESFAPDAFYLAYFCMADGSALASALGIDPVAGADMKRAPYWRSAHFALESKGHLTTLWVRELADLVTALRRQAELSPQVGASLAARGERHVTEHLSVHTAERGRAWPEGECLRGFRPVDENWIIGAGADLRVESYLYREDAPVMNLWTTFWPHRSLTRIYR